MRSTLATALLMTVLAPPAVPDVFAQAATGAKSIAERASGYRRIDGFFPLYWDDAGGRLFMEIGRFDQEILYQVSLPAGVGSNPIGLDRGQLGDTRVVVFERVGPRVLMVEPNYRYRAISSNDAERRAVRDSFARSVIWGFKVEAAEGDRVLVDVTPLVLRDAHGVGDRLRQRRQGTYRFEESRSAMFLPRTRGFPKNTEIEATITLITDGDPGPLVSQVAPTPQSVTVRQHHSFVELPVLDGSAYRPRKLDPRVGVFGIEFHDYASPITSPIDYRWISRHRLEKKDAGAAVSDPVEPIVYYVDNGAPEPIRSALVDGAAWWAKAFEAAGFRNGFTVKILPEDADPMDVRYNMINWVHRSTRGWSYGSNVTDPRTGQIIKGNVTLGSLRVRQDYLIGTGLVGLTAAADGPPLDPRSRDGREACEFGYVADADALAALDPASDVEAMSLARIRQLSAHEVGHTLGLAHNFTASTYGRASVMDYPAPLVKIANGRIDLSDAYGVGVGAYDIWAIRFAYSQFPPGAREDAALEQIVQEGVNAGMLYLTDADARPAGAAHPLNNLWDNGSDPVESLRQAMDVRKIALGSFGIGSIADGSPLSLLEVKLLPLYLYHRYQLQAAVKTIGGAYYSYAVKSGGQPSPRDVLTIVPAARQRDALAAVLDTLAPQALAIPAAVLALVPPRAFGFGGANTEMFPSRTDPVFDPIGAATIAADLAISGLLQPQRAARLIDFHARSAENPSLEDVIGALVKRTWLAPLPADAHQREIARATQSLVVTRLMDLAAAVEATPQVRAQATQALRGLKRRLETTTTATGVGTAHAEATAEDIGRFLARPDTTYKRIDPFQTPAGDPIGGR